MCRIAHPLSSISHEAVRHKLSDGSSKPDPSHSHVRRPTPRRRGARRAYQVPSDSSLSLAEAAADGRSAAYRSSAKFGDRDGDVIPLTNVGFGAYHKAIVVVFGEYPLNLLSSNQEHSKVPYYIIIDIDRFNHANGGL